LHDDFAAKEEMFQRKETAKEVPHAQHPYLEAANKHTIFLDPEVLRNQLPEKWLPSQKPRQSWPEAQSRT
jgi:hypothetical protein